MSLFPEHPALHHANISRAGSGKAGREVARGRTYLMAAGVAVSILLAIYVTIYPRPTQSGDFMKDERWRAEFIDGWRRTCEKDNRYTGASDEQIAAYCECTATKFPNYATSEEIEDYINKKVVLPSLQKKMDEAAADCARAATTGPGAR